MVNYFKKESNGVGGMLFLIVAAFMSMGLIITICFVKGSTAKSVGESVSHTIAMECLASCYVRPAQEALQNQEFKEWDSNDTFAPIGLTGASIDPCATFNDIMGQYRLMRTSDPVKEGNVKMRYIKEDWTPGHSGEASFEIDFGTWSCFNNWWANTLKIHCNPTKVTIEKTYKG